MRPAQLRNRFYAVRRADDADPYFLCPSRLVVCAIEEQAIFRMRGGLSRAELEVWFETMHHFK